MYYTDDPIADFHRYDAEKEAELEKQPTCYECGYKIQDEYCFEYNGECICEKCLIDNHRKNTEDFME